MKLAGYHNFYGPVLLKGFVLPIAQMPVARHAFASQIIKS